MRKFPLRSWGDLRVVFVSPALAHKLRDVVTYQGVRDAEEALEEPVEGARSPLKSVRH